MVKKVLFFLVTFISFRSIIAQSPTVYSSSEILLQLQKLKVLGSVLYVAAHPDDENTRLLAYLSREKKYRTGYLSLTRGDGGQNLIGEEQGIALGLIRTQELLAARRIDRAEQFFSTAYDFGFSKNSDETFNIWNKEKILSDVVWVIRKFQPDIIITRFPEDSRAGHGQHAASGILAREAFYAAADPERFPEQFSYGAKVWQAKRLLWNSFSFGASTSSDTLFKVDIGGFNPLVGKSYGEIAAESRSQHKSQGFGVPASRGKIIENFSPVAGGLPAKDFMEGVDISWKRANNDRVTLMIDRIISEYHPVSPEKSVHALTSLLQYLRQNINNSYWTVHKISEVEELIKACLGFYFEATANQQFAVIRDSLKITFTAVNRSHFPIKKIRIIFNDSTYTLPDSLSYNTAQSVSFNWLVDEPPLSDQPYWLKEQMTEGRFEVSNQELVGLAENPSKKIQVVLPVGETMITFPYPLQYKYTDPVKGEIYQPVVTVPGVLTTLLPSVVLTNVVPKTTPYIHLKYQSLVNGGIRQGNILFNNGKTISRPYTFNLIKNKTELISFQLDSLSADKSSNSISTSIKLTDSAGHQSFSNSIRTVNYDHIPTISYLYQSKLKLIHDEVRTAGKRVGYIRGAGDNVPDALQALGYQVVILQEPDLNRSMLSSFDAIITGIRAYNVNSFLIDRNDVLMDYVKNGGNLIVQYNTNSQVGPNKAKIGPYAFNISRSRVSDEKSPITFLLPGHQVLNYPNKISGKDFENWVQERGIYFADQLDPKFETPLSMSDPGEDQQKGSLIIADYGKGKFVYTGLVFFRQLPAGVSGAYRILANIIALNKKEQK